MDPTLPYQGFVTILYQRRQRGEEESRKGEEGPSSSKMKPRNVNLDEMSTSE